MKNYMKSIIFKYLEGRASDAEQAELMGWLRHKENLYTFRECKKDWENSLRGVKTPQEYQDLWDRIQSSLFRKSFEVWERQARFNAILKIAAVFLLLFSIGTVYYILSGKKEKSAEYITTIVADNGQISKIILPDSSLVWFNSGTTLSYSNLYAIKNRDLLLNGEAWFQVRKNENLPMVVNCSELYVKVHGTCFNVSAFKGYDKIDVVLEKGLVELYENLNGEPVCRLKPGELAEFNRNNHALITKNVNTTRYSSWKEGMINFYNLRLEEVVMRLERRYNQQFMIDKRIKDIPLTFTIKNESLENILKLIERIAPVSAVQINNQINLNYDHNKALRMEKKN
jgi:transmembrane sensor